MSVKKAEKGSGSEFLRASSLDTCVVALLMALSGLVLALKPLFFMPFRPSPVDALGTLAAKDRRSEGDVTSVIAGRRVTVRGSGAEKAP